MIVADFFLFLIARKVRLSFYFYVFIFKEVVFYETFSCNTDEEVLFYGYRV